MLVSAYFLVPLLYQHLGDGVLIRKNQPGVFGKPFLGLAIGADKNDGLFRLFRLHKDELIKEGVLLVSIISIASRIDAVKCL